RRLQMGPDGERYDQLQAQMAELWNRRQAEDAEGSEDAGALRRRMRADPDFSALRSELREIGRKYPLDWMASVERIERQLPEDQIRQGRSRWRGRRERWRDRSRERAEQAAARLEKHRVVQGPTRDVEASRKMKAETKAAEKPAGSDRRAKEQRPPKEAKPGGSAPGARQKKAEKKAREKSSDREAAKEGFVEVRLPDEWELHVQQFTERHELTPTQANAALSILKDLRIRAVQIEQFNKDRIAAAEQIEDSAARRARLEELRAPIRQLFDELKKRLDGLLTASQRAKQQKK
ncbi:MAG: hypothetical protein V3S01_02550, partial [Dehalococcoidia bacterium]